MITNVQKIYIKLLHQISIATENVQTVQNLYKVQTKNDLKLEMCVFLYIETMYKLYKSYTIS